MPRGSGEPAGTYRVTACLPMPRSARLPGGTGGRARRGRHGPKQYHYFNLGAPRAGQHGSTTSQSLQWTHVPSADQRSCLS